MNFIKLLQQRRSHNDYDPIHQITHDEIKYLIELATMAPSAYHLQNWHFIAVSSEEGKSKLFQACYGQDKVKTASVTFIICGNVSGHINLENALAPAFALKQISKKTQDAWITAVKSSHENNATLRYTEAIRSASLAAMTLIMAAEDQGYATGPMSGFDVEKLMDLFYLNKDLIPVMLVTVGKPIKERYVSKARLPVDDVLSFV